MKMKNVSKENQKRRNQDGKEICKVSREKKNHKIFNPEQTFVILVNHPT